MNVLEKSEEHLSAEDIYIRIHRDDPGVGLTTVYRTLDMLTSLGMVDKFDFGDGRARYEMAEGPGRGGHHHHLVCTGCRKVIDYDDFIEKEVRLLRETEAGLSKKYNFKINSHQIQFYGLCGQCLQKT